MPVIFIKKWRLWIYHSVQLECYSWDELSLNSVTLWLMWLIQCKFMRFFTGRSARTLQRESRVQFFQRWIEWINRPTSHVLLQSHIDCTFYTSNNIEKKMINNKFKAQTVTRNPTGNSRCHALASCAFDMSCRFGQSVRSMESRCVV